MGFKCSTRGGDGKCTKVSVEMLQGRDHLVYLGVECKIILKCAYLLTYLLTHSMVQDII